MSMCVTGRMAILSRDIDHRVPRRHLKVDVTSSCNQLLRDVRMIIVGSDKDRRASILPLKIDVTVSFNQLFCDSSMSICCRDQERDDPK